MILVDILCYIDLIPREIPNGKFFWVKNMSTNSERYLDIHPGAIFMATFGDEKEGCQFKVAIFEVNPLTKRVRTVEYDQDGNPNWRQGAIGPFSLKDLEHGRYGEMQLNPITPEE